ncbi:MAG: tRNA 2-selenouridine(34) synthase MnmH [Planctomycetota bacterium]
MTDGAESDTREVRVPYVGIERLHERGGPAQLIDLRAPVEFDDDHVPGAVNVPLFENQTRSFVGLLYRQFSPDAAFQEGRAAVAERIDELVQDVARHIGWDVPGADLRARVLAMTGGGIDRLDRELAPFVTDDVPEDAVVFSCARGGLRSRSVVALMRSLGLENAVGLDGGYRAYRRRVMDTLAAWTPPSHVVSLRGLTGVGKTLVLRAIEALRPGWTLDLEGIAGHRSSLLGMVGLKPVTQKAFESGLVARLAECTRGGAPADLLVVEGESRKVGDVVIPGPLWTAMRGATNVEVVASTRRRVEVLAEDYLADPDARPLLREQLEAVSRRMDGAPDLAGMLDRDEIGPLVEALLEGYYDPLYRGSEAGKEYAVQVSSESAEGAAAEVVAWVEEHLLGVDSRR